MKILRQLLASDYGMLGALLALCLFFSWVTYAEQQPIGAEAAERLLDQVDEKFPRTGSVVVLGRVTNDSKTFCEMMRAGLKERGWNVRAVVNGGPPQAGRAIRKAFDANGIEIPFP
ncbi:MAG: hypothetical protein VB997_09395, partial [Opitutales bacterium]